MQIKLVDGKSIWEKGWYFIGGKKIYFRSKWEYMFACYLETLKEKKTIINWEYETDTFWFEHIKRGVRSYTPDFKITHPSLNQEFIEVKGYMDSKSKTKLKRMRIYYPEIKIRVVDKEWFAKNNKSLKALVNIMSQKNSNN